MTYSCEHYNPMRNRHHLFDFDLDSQTSLNVLYLEALFHDDLSEVSRIEQDAAMTAGAHPEGSPATIVSSIPHCSVVANITSQRSHCRKCVSIASSTLHILTT